MKKRVIAILICSLVSLLLVSCKKTADTTEGKEAAKKTEVTVKKAPKPEFTMTAAELANGFTDEEAGNKKYKGKVVQVSGTVSEIGQDPMGAPFVSMKGDNDMVGVAGMFTEDDQDAVSKIKVGDKLSIIGTVDEVVIYVQLKDCFIVK